MDRIKEISNKINEIKQWPSFSSGDTITVTYKIKGTRKIHNPFREPFYKEEALGSTETFTIRKMLAQLAKEFSIGLAVLEKIVVNKEGAVRRSKLFLFKRKNRICRIKEKTF